MKALSLFKRIAVREKFGVEFLQRNGIDAVEVIDPTLLLESYRDLLPHKVEERNEIIVSFIIRYRRNECFCQRVIC